MAQTATTRKPAVKPVEDFLEEYAGEGLQNLSPEDLQIPRIKLLQPMNPELDPGKPTYIKGAKVGEFILTLPGISLGKEISVIPLWTGTFWMEWLPGRGGFVGRHLPGSVPCDKSDFSNWFRPDTGNELQESREFMVMLSDHMEYGPILMSFTSTAIKSARAWLSLCTLEKTPSGKPAPLFANIWKLKSISQSNDKGSWYNISSVPEKVRMITQEEFTTHIGPGREVANAINSRMIESPVPKGQKQIANTGTAPEEVAY